MLEQELRFWHVVSGLWVDKTGVHRHREWDQERAVAVECYSQLVSSRDDLGNYQARWSRRVPPGQSTSHLAASSSGRDEDGGQAARRTADVSVRVTRPSC